VKTFREELQSRVDRAKARYSARVREAMSCPECGRMECGLRVRASTDPALSGSFRFCECGAEWPFETVRPVDVVGIASRLHEKERKPL
jgi:hypothetical protein